MTHNDSNDGGGGGGYTEYLPSDISYLPIVSTRRIISI